MSKRLLSSASILALAAAAAWAGQITLGAALTVTPSQPTYGLGQQVQFQVTQGNNPVGIPSGAVFTIEQQQPNGSFTEVFHGTARTPATGTIATPYAGGIFTWNQNTSQGAAVPAGTYRVNYYASGNTRREKPKQATFTITNTPAPAPAPGPVTPSGIGSLGLVFETPTVRPGILPRIRLQNTGSAPLSLQGEHYVIQRNEGGRWVEVFASSANGLHVTTLNPGQVLNFTAPARMRDGRLLTSGDYRILFYAPALNANPIVQNYRIEGAPVPPKK